LYALGLLAAETRQFDLAEAYFLDLIKRKTRLAEAYFELGRIEEQRGDLRQGPRSGMSGSRTKSAICHAQMRMGVVLAKAGEIAAAGQHFDTLRRNNPQNGITLYLAEAEALREAERYQEAFDSLERALAAASRRQGFAVRSGAGRRKNRPDGYSGAGFARHSGCDPKNSQALNALGYTLADRTDRYQEALGYIEQALAQLPDDAAVLDSMGWVQYRLGHRDKALEYLRRAYQANPDAEIAAHLSEVLWVSGQREEAKKIWKEALTREPNSVHLRKLRERFGW
jgi:tetratricopeptide (TPR) repeat protein